MQKTTIKVNVLEKEITMTNTTAKKASSINTDEYNQLLQATRDFPNFTIKIIAPKMKKDSSRGLTVALMENLIEVMAKDSEKAIKEFEAVKKCYEGTNFHFSKLKAHFISQYPEWREWLPNVEEQQEEQEQKESEAAAVEENEPMTEHSEAKYNRPVFRQD